MQACNRDFILTRFIYWHCVTIGRRGQKAQLFYTHWRQPRRGCRGHIPQWFCWGTSMGISPILLHTLNLAPQNSQYANFEITKQKKNSGEGQWSLPNPPLPPLVGRTPNPFVASSLNPPTLNLRWSHWALTTLEHTRFGSIVPSYLLDTEMAPKRYERCSCSCASYN